MFVSETCVAMHHAAVERDGLVPASIRSMLLGRIAGSVAGGFLYRHLGKESVYCAEAALFWCLLVAQACCLPMAQVSRSDIKRAPRRSMIVYMTVRGLLPDPSVSLFFFYSDRLRFSSVQFGWLDAAGALAVYVGTYYSTLRHVVLRQVAATWLYWFFTQLVVTRWVYGYDFTLVLVPVVVMSFAESALATQYTVSTGADVTCYSSLAQLARAGGFGLSTGMTAAFGINHDSYGSLLLFVSICAWCSAAVSLYACVVDDAQEQERGHEEELAGEEAEPDVDVSSDALEPKVPHYGLEGDCAHVV